MYPFTVVWRDHTGEHCAGFEAEYVAFILPNGS